jgi:hypothetical protein
MVAALHSFMQRALVSAVILLFCCACPAGEVLVVEVPSGSNVTGERVS